MTGIAILEMLFLFLIVFDSSDASFGWELRKLADVVPNDNNTAIHDSPPPVPVPVDKKSDPRPVDETEKKKTDPPSSNEIEKVDPKGSNNTVSPASPPLAQTNNEKVDPNGSNNSTPASSPPIAKRDYEKSHEKGKKNEGETISHSHTDEKCDDLSVNTEKCRDDGDIEACISESGSNYLVVLIQNGGDSTLKVKVFMETNLGGIEVLKHKTEKINISLTSSRSAQLTLNAGKRDCVLHTGVDPERSIFVRLPSYDELLTPVNGAYFLISTVIIFGGAWACCKLRKKRQHDGVPYQELEMALPESVSATEVGTADGWDQGWDDDWDEDVAVKSAGRHHAGSISADGLTSRSSNRDGWENNWDD